MKNKRIIIRIICALIIILTCTIVIIFIKKDKRQSLKIDLTNLTYVDKRENINITRYTQEDFADFFSEYENGNLPDVYITEFLFDGVSMYKPYDLDDFIEKGNDIDVEILNTTVVNINKTGNIELSGKLDSGMIAVDTNNINDDIRIILNDVSINTDSKKIPALYVYNKDITYNEHKVVVSAANNTKNYLEGGKLKKVSLISTDNLGDYQSNYSGDTNLWYSKYSNYYGVYNSNQINNILFAKVTADMEDLQDGDPYYYYKASGAISSDIDLYFEGKGYLEVTSKNKEGIESKGNLIFSGGIGDYVINAMDDCLNTTTSSNENTNARNTLTIDVNSLTAVVSLEADEGDAIDSNGDLIINGGRIIAIAKPGQDAGLDSETGTYINGGTIIATGDMYDEIKESSIQRFITLSFNKSVNSDLIALLGSEYENVIFAFESDREYKTLVYSSSNLLEGTYNLYQSGVITGEATQGFYTKISKYNKGELLGYFGTGISNLENFGPNGMNPNGEKPELPNDETPNDENKPEMPNGQMPSENGDKQKPNDSGKENTEIKAINKYFVISDAANVFNGVGLYVSEES